MDLRQIEAAWYCKQARLQNPKDMANQTDVLDLFEWLQKLMRQHGRHLFSWNDWSFCSVKILKLHVCSSIWFKTRNIDKAVRISVRSFRFFAGGGDTNLMYAFCLPFKTIDLYLNVWDFTWEVSVADSDYDYRHGKWGSIYDSIDSVVKVCDHAIRTNQQNEIVETIPHLSGKSAEQSKGHPTMQFWPEIPKIQSKS